jgi:serine/threonine protein kinase
MAEVDPTQRDLTAGIAEELAAAGFEDVHEIGRGGFGVVYRCAQRSLDRSVAIKVLTADLGPTTSNDSSASSAPWESSPGTRI